MAAYQGFNKLTKGFLRKLNKSEVNRGYVHISNDKVILGLNGIKIFVNEANLGEKKPDKWGRVIIGREFTQKMSNKSCFFKLENKTLLIKF